MYVYVCLCVHASSCVNVCESSVVRGLHYPNQTNLVLLWRHVGMQPLRIDFPPCFTRLGPAPFVSPRSPTMYPTGWSRVQSSVVVQYWPLNSASCNMACLLSWWPQLNAMHSFQCTELWTVLSIEEELRHLNIPLIFTYCKGKFILVQKVWGRGGEGISPLVLNFRARWCKFRLLFPGKWLALTIK